jgi:hypothetical protein
MVELQKIGLLGEFTELKIYVNNSFNNVEEPESIPDCSLEEQIKQVREQYFPKDAPDFQGFQSQANGEISNNKSAEEPLMEEKGKKRIKKKGSSQILS